MQAKPDGPGRNDHIIDPVSQKVGCFLTVCAGAALWIFAEILGEGIGTAAGASTAAILAAIAVLRPLHRRVWFWVAIAGIVALHGMALLILPWPETDISGIQLFPIMFADFIVITGVIFLLHKIVAAIRNN